MYIHDLWQLPYESGQSAELFQNSSFVKNHGVCGLDEKKIDEGSLSNVTFVRTVKFT